MKTAWKLFGYFLRYKTIKRTDTRTCYTLFYIYTDWIKWHQGSYHCCKLRCYSLCYVASEKCHISTTFSYAPFTKVLQLWCFYVIGVDLKKKTFICNPKLRNKDLLDLIHDKIVIRDVRSNDGAFPFNDKYSHVFKDNAFLDVMYNSEKRYKKFKWR